MNIWFRLTGQRKNLRARSAADAERLDFLSLKVKTKADAERLDFEPRAGLINIKQEESDYEK